MALAKSTALYELLIRFDRDGNYQASHVIDLETITDGDEVVAAKELPARPITKAEVGSIIGDNNARLIEAADAAIAELNLEREARASAEQAKTEAERRAAEAEGQVEGLSARLSSAVQQVEALKADALNSTSAAE